MLQSPLGQLTFLDFPFQHFVGQCNLGRALFDMPGIFAAYAASNVLVGAGAAYWGWSTSSRAPQRELAPNEI